MNKTLEKCIFSSPVSPATAKNFATQLSQRSVPHRLLWINDIAKNDLNVAKDIRACSGFIFIVNNLDSAAIFFDPATLAGNAIHAKLAAGSAILF